jgi:hypothetical protein
MAIAPVFAAVASPNTGSNITLTYAGVSGRLYVVLGGSSLLPSAPTGVTDDGGNTWTLIESTPASGTTGRRAFMYYTVATSSFTVVTVAHDHLGQLTASLAEVTGFDNTTTLDTHASISRAASLTPAAITATPTNSGSLEFCIIQCDTDNHITQVTVPSGFTDLTGYNSLGPKIVYKIGPTTGTPDGAAFVLTVSQGCGLVTAFFNAAASGTPITMSDSATLTDVTIVAANSTMTDSGTESETMGIKVGTAQPDSATATDTMGIQVNVALADSQTQTETSMSVGVLVPITMTDGGTQTDSMAIGIGIPESDTATQTDTSFTIAGSASLPDSATLTDSMSIFVPGAATQVFPIEDSIVGTQTQSMAYPPALRTIGVPPQEVQDAITAGVVQVRRRVEIYESDGVTPFAIANWDARLNSGSVTVDGTRDERRMIDVTLENGDFLLNENPYGGFYYDKILKAFWGVEYYTQNSVTNYVIKRKSIMPTDGTFESGSVTGWTPSSGDTFAASSTFAHTGTKSALLTVVGTKVTVTARTAKVLVSPGGSYNVEGWAQATVARANISMTIDWYDSSNAFISSSASPKVDVPAGFWMLITGSGIAPPNAAKAAIGPTMSNNPANGNTLYVDDIDFYTNVQVATGTTPRGSLKFWETQLGEFMIDQIDEDRFPNLSHVTGRDYTKICLKSDITQSETFDSTYPVETIITGLAANAGIVKFRMPITGLYLATDITADIGAARWAIMVSVADAVGYEVYFTADGYLTMRPYQDPVTAPLVFTFKQGEDGGTLVSYKKSGDDSLLKNHTLVIGATVTDDLGISTTAYGESFNDDPLSPTRRFNPDGSNHMGDRLDLFTSDFITSQADAQALSDTRLRVMGLEEFSVDLSSLMIPWLDANDIIEVIEPNESEYIPTRFLFSNFTLPLGLGPMTGNAKRVTIVGTSSNIGAIA